jgi:C4-type Zn-finger protein
MALTKEQIARATKHVRKYLRHCPICGSDSWELVDVVNTIPYAGRSIVVGGPTAPMLLVACSNCKYTIQFAAVPLGLAGTESRSK